MKGNPRIKILGIASATAAANCSNRTTYSPNRHQTPSRSPRAGIGISGDMMTSGGTATATRRPGDSYLKNMTNYIGGAKDGLHDLMGAIVGTTGSGGDLAYAATSC